MTKEPISLRLDNDLLERTRRLCEREKTTLTQMVTDVLLAHIQKREYEIEHLSHSPRAAANRGKMRKRAPLSSSVKRKIKEKYDYTCQRCGVTEQEWRKEHPEKGMYGYLHVAHIIPQVQFEDPEKAHREDNLTVLCPRCHQRDHRFQRDYIDYNNRIK